jgi:hypothetical protein
VATPTSRIGRPPGIDMKLILAIFILFAFSNDSTADAGKILLIGHFSNQKVSDGEDPHILSGYSVSLFQLDEVLFGKIGVATGSGEAVPGRLYDIEFDRATKKIRFKAKYSEGYEYSKQIGPGGRPSRKLLIFSGRLAPNSLAGMVILKDGYNLDDAGKKLYVVMKKTKFDYKPDSFEQWVELRSHDVSW